MSVKKERVYLSPPHMNGTWGFWMLLIPTGLPPLDQTSTLLNAVGDKVGVSFGGPVEWNLFHLALEILGVGPGDEILVSSTLQLRSIRSATSGNTGLDR